MERYGLYGVIPKEREFNKPSDFATQNVGDSGDVLIYETDDREEARAIYEAGGFEKDGVWHVVTRAEDRTKHPQQSTVKSALDKSDYDQA